MTKPFKLIQVSDIHFGGEHKAAVEAAVERIHAERPDLVIAAGDLTKDGKTAEFDAAQAWLDRLPRPRLVTPGNHDIPFAGPREILWRLVAPWRRYQSRFGRRKSQDWDDPRVTVVALNTARAFQLRLNWSKGAVSRQQIREVCADLKDAAPGALKIVVCHHPLIEMIGGPMTAKVRGGTAAAQAFAQAGADLVLTGHIHAPFVHPYPFSDGCTQAVGSGTLSVRERGVPAGFNLIEVDDVDIRITALAWERTRFVTWRTWSVPRRCIPKDGPNENGATEVAPLKV
ncbi:metallophosphoesterase [Caulobacter sp. Root655]|uniref:metallophosphoesterase family protein n=1 Tax=Caulobacter sp. Root655 TaxID=1736578 RepID=UPI0007012CB1|nr:metallophosphoesterase [Caulobacter sp. Root655]KRA56186.1 metallophosphoesterase [Caulobacter sp. Root655]